MQPVIESQKAYVVTKGQAASILICMLVLLGINYADRTVLSVVLQQIKESLMLSDTQLGLIQTAFSITVGAVTIPLGWIIDRWSRRKMAGIMALVWSIATLLTGMATSFVGLIIARAAVGLGEDGFTSLGSGWLSVAFKKKQRSWVTGILGVGTIAGGAMGFIVGGMILKATGMWQAPFFVFGFIGIVFGIWAFYLKDYKSPKLEGEGQVIFSRAYFKGWAQLFQIKSFVLICVVGQVLWSFTYQTWIGWLPAFMMRSYSLDAETVGTTVGLAGLTGILGALAAGYLSHVWYQKNQNARIYVMTIAQFGFASFFFLANFFMGTLSVSVITLLLVGAMVSVGGIAAMIYALPQDISPVSHRFSAFAIQACLAFAFASLGPWLVGAVSDAAGGGAGGVREGLLWLVPSSVACVIAYVICWKYYPRDSASVSDAVLAEK